MTKQRMSRTIDKGIDGRLRLKRDPNWALQTKGMDGIALDHSPIQRDLIYSKSLARAGLGQAVSGWAAGLECSMSGAKVRIRVAERHD